MKQPAGAIATCLLAGMLVVPNAHAGECEHGKSLLTAQVDIRVISLDLVATMRLLGKQTKVNMALSSGLKGTLKRQHLKGPLNSVLDDIADQVGTVWWWSGDEIRMTGRSDTLTRSIEFPSMSDLVDAAKRLCLPVEAVQFRNSRPGGLIRVSGPSDVVREIEDLVKSLRASYGRARITEYGQQRVHKFY